MTRYSSLLALVLAALVASGCSVLVDGTLAGRGGSDAGLDSFVLADTNPARDTGPMIDTGPAGPCTGQLDGLHCDIPGLAEPFLCIGGVCTLSRCGDGQRDNRMGSMHEPEQCDDGNAIDGDGCDSDCTYSCATNADCLDTETCNGMETCDTTTTHACVAGTMVADNTACTIPMSSTMAVCHAGTCRSGACPDGVHDPGEDCDDGNHVDGDGCNSDCTFSCVTDSDCQDGDPCNGAETCATTHICQPPTATLDCNDGDSCTTDSCVAMMGCLHDTVLVDADHDGYFAIDAACGGDDCDDTNPNAHPTAPEPCGSTSDLNCDTFVGMTPVWYVDCDGDGYAHSTTGSVTNCTMPGPPSGCASPGWTTRVPSSPSTTDCLDSASGGSLAYPGQTSYYSTPGGITPPYDYDCNGNVSHQVVLFGHPYVQTRGYVECAYTSAGRFFVCGGTEYWDQTSIPACGALGRLSHCVISGVSGCVRTFGNVAAACH